MTGDRQDAMAASSHHKQPKAGHRALSGNALPASQPPALPPGLHVVSVPIGNLADLSPRAARVLGSADLVAAEDTRVTRRLLTSQGLSARLTAYNDHNAPRVLPRLMARLQAGERIALVSDAGTPLVSDPGYRLVAACHAAGVPVQAVPGASALLAGLVVAGLPSDRFLFLGFLPAKRAARRTAIAEVAAVRASLVVFESTRRLAATLADMTTVLGPRLAAIGRELTKRHEEVRRGTLNELAAALASEPPPRGEAVIIIAPPAEDSAHTGADTGDESADHNGRSATGAALDQRLAAALAEESLKSAVARVSAETGLPRRQVYSRALTLQRPRRQP
ncbi:MAG: 16S rRNA (cytidine(1402)-2'-O)-methyltransferase [Alphaproteobacteria bacterium]